MGKQLTMSERAERERRRARGNRIVSVVMFVVAGLFAVAGVALLIITGKPTSIITITSAVVIASSGFSLRMTAATQVDTAGRFDRIARGGF